MSVRPGRWGGDRGPELAPGRTDIMFAAIFDLLATGSGFEALGAFIDIVSWED